MPDTTTLKTTPAGEYKFAKAIQETRSLPEVNTAGVVIGSKTEKVGDPVKTIDYKGRDVKVGDTFNPTQYWVGRHVRLVDDGFIVKVADSPEAMRLEGLEELKKAAAAGDFDALKPALEKLKFKRPKAKTEAFEFAAAILRLAQEV